MNNLYTENLKCKLCGARSDDGRFRNIVGKAESSGKFKVICINCSAQTVSCNTLAEAVKKWEKGEYTIPCHSEKEILNGCIQLMNMMVGYFEDYISFMGFDIDSNDKEQQFEINIPYSTIVNKLFLSNTSHSGGTSTSAKCRELGIGSWAVNFVAEPLEK